MRNLITALVVVISILTCIPTDNQGFIGRIKQILSISNFNIPGKNNLGNIQEPANTIPVILDRVVDGDTLTIKFNPHEKPTRVRLLLIDTPESVKPNTPVQPFAKEASERMRELVIGAKITIEYDRGGSTDKYGRSLAYVYANGVNVNEVMVAEGYARVAYVYPPNTRYLQELNQAQDKAKSQKLRVWSKPGYVTNKGFVE